MAGEVNISAAVTEAQTQQTSNFDRRITVDGVSAGLVARTNRDAYTDGEPIQSTATITTNATFGVIDANLDLAVYKINSATDGSFKHFLPSGWLPHIYDWTEVLIAGSSDGFVNFFWEGRILKYDIDGNLITQWGSSGSEDGQFFEPCSMAGGPDGFLYVADTGNYRIQKFDRNGNFIAKWGTYGTGDGQFDLLRGIAVDQGGFVYAIDLYRIQKFDSNGNFITK
jgi:DNA-binding beta-propeller fold protein YncE